MLRWRIVAGWAGLVGPSALLWWAVTAVLGVDPPVYVGVSAGFVIGVVGLVVGVNWQDRHDRAEAVRRFDRCVEALNLPDPERWMDD